MKLKYLLIAIALVGCNAGEQQNKTTPIDDTLKVQDDTIVENDNDSSSSKKIYSNERFKEVTVEKISGNSFLIKGKAQIFEANFSWVIEDGHEELNKGFQMTDAGAPEWGNFSFTVEAQKKRANSTLNIILFESSAMDGSRQHELPVLLY